MIQNHKINLARFAALALMIVMSGAVFSATPIGKVVMVIGAVDVFRASGPVGKPLSKNDSIFVNDRIVTGVGSQAKLLLRDDSILKIGQSSELVIDLKVAGPGEASQTRIELLKGRLRSVIGRKLGPLSSYEVHTKVAVTGVRGTDYEVWVRSLTETAVRVFMGQVEVRNLLRNILGSVMLTPNTFTLVSQNTRPRQPASIPPGKSLGEQLDGVQETGEQDLDQAEEQQIQDLDLSEGSEAGNYVATEFELGTGLGTVSSERPNINEIVNDAVGGDVTSKQIDAVTQPVAPAGGIDIPINIEFPTP